VVGIEAAELELESLRSHVHKMSDEELLRFGQATKFRSIPIIRDLLVLTVAQSGATCSYWVHPTATAPIKADGNRSECQGFLCAF